MFVTDILEDCKSVTNFTDDNLNFSRITDAVEVLSNRGNLDSLLGYVDIPFTDNLITLPRDVEVPLAVNINDNPSFARDRLYEFTMNGPGSNTERVGWQWEDKGDSATFQIMDPTVYTTVTTISDMMDDGVIVNIIGDTTAGYGRQERLVLNSANPEVSVYAYNKITNINTGDIVRSFRLMTSPGGLPISNYLPGDPEPMYRRIRVSVKEGVAHIMFRRTRFKVTSLDSFIPIRSKMGLILMLKSLEAYREERFDVAKVLGDQAVEVAVEEQKGHNTYIDLSQQSQAATVRNLGYNNSDTIIMADIYDEACQIVGPISEPSVYDKTTEAIRILSAKAQWDAQRGYVDIQTDQYKYVTLPRYVDYVIKLNMNDRPSDMKNKWFRFNSNGPGQQWTPCQSWVDVGSVVTHRDVLYTQNLMVVPDLVSDAGVEFRVYGYYLGKRIYSTAIDGSLVDGFLVAATFDGNVGSTQLVDRIERITKSKTTGFVRLFGLDVNGDNQIQLGYYHPDETEPNYRRIELPAGCETVRIMYRRRNLKIDSLTDPIPLGSKTAVLTMLRAIELLNQGKVQEAEAMEAKAVKYLSEDYAIMNQSETKTLDFGSTFTVSDQFVQC